MKKKVNFFYLLSTNLKKTCYVYCARQTETGHSINWTELNLYLHPKYLWLNLFEMWYISQMTRYVIKFDSKIFWTLFLSEWRFWQYLQEVGVLKHTVLSCVSSHAFRESCLVWLKVSECPTEQQTDSALMAPVCDSIPCDCLPHSEAQMCAMGSAMQPSVLQIIQHIHQRNEEKYERREILLSSSLHLLILSASLSGKVQC